MACNACFAEIFYKMTIIISNYRTTLLSALVIVIFTVNIIHFMTFYDFLQHCSMTTSECWYGIAQLTKRAGEKSSVVGRAFSQCFAFCFFIDCHGLQSCLLITKLCKFITTSVIKQFSPVEYSRFWQKMCHIVVICQLVHIHSIHCNHVICGINLHLIVACFVFIPIIFLLLMHQNMHQNGQERLTLTKIKEIAMSLIIKLTKLHHYGQKLNTIIFWPTPAISLSYLHFLFHNIILSLILITFIN